MSTQAAACIPEEEGHHAGPTMLAAGEDTTLLAVEEDILVEGHRVETLVVADEEGSHQKVGIDPRVAVVEVRQIATAGILLDLVDWYCRAQRWIPSLDQYHSENDPRCQY